MTTRYELLELADNHSYHLPVVKHSLARYNRASADMIQHATELGLETKNASLRVTHPKMGPTLDTSHYTTLAIKMATAERMAWEALFEIACGLQEANIEVEW